MLLITLNIPDVLCEDTFNIGPGQCEDIDECIPINANHTGWSQCINTFGSYYQECLEGFESMDNVSSQCRDIDECLQLGPIGACGDENKDGLPDGQCLNMIGTYECADMAVMNNENNDNFPIHWTAMKQNITDGKYLYCMLDDIDIKRLVHRPKGHALAFFKIDL